eukprot:RCo038998
MASAGSYLDNFRALTEGLTTALTKNLTLMREDDLRCQLSFTDLHGKEAEYLEAEGMDDGELQEKILEEIAAKQQQILSLSDAKIQLAIQNIDLVQGSLSKLDEDLKNFVAQLISTEEQDGSWSGMADDTAGALPSCLDASDISGDPDEPVYCTCRRVSFGDMVQCDAPTCPYEWFHFECVQLSQAPKGKWFCPHCRYHRMAVDKAGF